ncbi:MFS transporter [Paenibacillus sp. FSL L8-0638]|uniref:MFS transporter n=1 Tax=Paenibacillus TaxID=44249 RepID=UPI00315972BB
MVKKFESQVRLFGLLRFLNTFYVYNSILVFYFSNMIKLNYTQIGIVMASYYTASILFDIPTGMIGDLIGKKKAILIGAVFQCIGIFLMGSLQTYMLLIIAHIIFALGSSFISGSEQGLIYKLHEKHDKLDVLNRSYGKIFSASILSTIAAALLSSVVIQYSYSVTFYISAFSNFLAVFFVCLVHEERVYEDKTGKKAFQRVRPLQIMKESFQEIRVNRQLLLFSIYYIFTAIILTSVFFQYQPYLQHLKISPTFFGVIYALFGIIPLISAQLSHLIKGKYIYILNPLILAVVFLGMALTKSIWLGIVLICLFRFNWGIIIPKIQSHIDTSITSETSRATTVSTVYSVHNLLLSMMLIISGHLIESYSIAVLLIIYSLFSLLFCLYVFIFRRSYNNTDVPSKSTLMMDSKEL